MRYRSWARMLAGILTTILLISAPAMAITVKKQEREDKLPVGMASAYNGAIGLHRLASPIILPKSTFSLLAHLRYWQQADFMADDIHVKRLETGGAVSISLNDYWEFFLAARSSSHLMENDVLGVSTLLQSVGDIDMGFKVGYRFVPVFYGGIELEALFRTQRGGLGPKWGATGIGTGLLMAADWTALPDPTPIRLTWNFGYRRDNSHKLLPDGSVGDPSSNYGLSILPDDDQFYYGIGIEVPQQYIDIFLEYSSEQFVDLNGSNEVVLPTGETVRRSRRFVENPQRFTPGVRIFPTNSINIDLATELGSPLFFKNAQYDVYGLGILEDIMPKWVFHAGVGYTFYPPEPVIPQEGHVVGFVYDKKTKEPVKYAVLSFPGTNFSSIITDKNGQYRSYSFEAGPVRVDVSRRGYFAASTSVVVRAASEVRQDFYLSQDVEQGKLMAVVVDDQGHPVSTATIEFQEGNFKPMRPDPGSGLAEAIMPPGVYTIVANAAEFVPKSLRVRIANKKTTKVTIRLQPEAQTGTLTGRVENVVGQPLGSILIVKETSKNIASDPNTGQYSSSMAVGTYTVRATAGGYKPIEKVVIIEKDRITDANFILEEVQKEGKLQGRVVDEKTGAGLFAVISFPNGEKGNLATDPDTGAFIVELGEGVYQIKVGSSAYQSKLVEVVITGNETAELTVGLKGYQKVKVTKEKIEITETIKFRSGKAIIKIDSYPILDEVASVLKSNPEFNIVVEGHTDSVGSAIANRELSLKRAEAVREYIISRGINAERLEAVGYGEDRPIADNATNEGRARNRRVEFRIVNADGEAVDTGFE